MGVSFSSPARECGGASVPEYRVGAKQDVRTPETWPSFHPWAAGLVIETPSCQEETGQGQSDPLEEMFSCTETPAVNSKTLEDAGVWQQQVGVGWGGGWEGWGGGGKEARQEVFLPS